MKLRINAGDKSTTPPPQDKAIADTYRKFIIPLSFEILDSAMPYYQAGLRNRPSYELLFNDYNQVINASKNDAMYKIKGILLLFEEEKPFSRDISKYYNPKIQKVTITIEGKPNQLYSQGIRSFEQYDEASKYFAEGRLANEVQKQLQLYDMSLGEYLVNKYALWLDFRTIDKKSCMEKASK